MTHWEHGGHIGEHRLIPTSYAVVAFRPQLGLPLPLGLGLGFSGLNPSLETKEEHTTDDGEAIAVGRPESPSENGYAISSHRPATIIIIICSLLAPTFICMVCCTALHLYSIGSDLLGLRALLRCLRLQAQERRTVLPPRG